MNISFNLLEKSDVHYEIFLPTGEIIFSSEIRSFDKGKHEWDIPPSIFEKAREGKPFDFYFVHIIYGDTVEKRKLLMKE